MPIIFKHERKRFKKNPDYSTVEESSGFTDDVKSSKQIENHNGDGLGDFITGVIPQITNFISNNKELVSSGVKAVTSVAGATKAVTDTVKQNNELKKLQLLREIRNKRLEKESESSTPSEIVDNKEKDNNKIIGAGFKLIG